MSARYCPVFERDGNRLLVLSSDFIADTHEDAYRISLGAMLVECILWGIKPAKDVNGLNEVIPVEDGLVYQGADLGGQKVAIISGPLFDATPSPEVPRE